jgi:hypothetical protein
MPKRPASACVGIPKEKCIHPCEMTKSIINEKYNHCRTKYLNIKKRVKKMKPSATKKKAKKQIKEIGKEMKKMEVAKKETTESATTLFGITDSLSSMMGSVLPSSNAAPENEPPAVPESTDKPMAKPAKKNKTMKKAKPVIPQEENAPELEQMNEMSEMETKEEPVVPPMEEGAVLNAENPEKPLVVL